MELDRVNFKYEMDNLPETMPSAAAAVRNCLLNILMTM